MDLTTTTITLSSIITIVGCLIAVATFFSKRNKNSKEDEARLIRMEKDLLYIREKVDGVNQRLDKQDNRLDKHDERIDKCEKDIIKINRRTR